MPSDGSGEAPEEVQADEYRIDELAREAGTTVRNVRAYQDRGLLAPPRRVGRVGIYSASHLARLRVIGELLGRGYTLANIAEMLDSWEKGTDLSEMLGLETALIGPWTEDRRVAVDMHQVKELLGTLDERMIEDARAAGIFEIVGDEVYLRNPRMLETAGYLVSIGIPVGELIASSRVVAEAADQMAGAFVDMFHRNIFEPLGTPPPPEKVPELAELVRQLRPLARNVAYSELARAMERRIKAEIGEQLARDLDSLSRQRAVPPPVGAEPDVGGPGPRD